VPAEIGILVEGSAVTAELARYFEALVDAGYLKPVPGLGPRLKGGRWLTRPTGARLISLSTRATPRYRPQIHHPPSRAACRAGILAEQDDKWVVTDRRYFSAEMKLLTQPLVMTSQEDLLTAIA